MTASITHTGLTIEDVDTIHECQRRLLNAAVLLELGLYRLLDGAEPPFDPEAIQQALLDVAQQVREDATTIGGRMENWRGKTTRRDDGVVLTLLERDGDEPGGAA